MDKIQPSYVFYEKNPRTKTSYKNLSRFNKYTLKYDVSWRVYTISLYRSFEQGIRKIPNIQLKIYNYET